MFQSNQEYFTSEEILRQHSFLRDDYNWSEETPDQLLSVMLLNGKYLKGKELTLISRTSFWRFLDFYIKWNNEVGKHIFHNSQDEFLTPGEIICEYPFLRVHYNWSILTPGILLSVSILHGKYLKGQHRSHIGRSSITTVINYYQSINDERIIRLNQQRPG